MSESLTDRALLLRRYRYGESSLVVHALTRHHGRIHALAKGAYRPKSAYYGALDLFDTLELGWRPNRRAELQVLRAARPLQLRRPITRDLERYRAALSSVELTDLGSTTGQSDPELYDNLALTLDRIASEIDPQLALLAGDLGFLRALGLSPALEGCAACGNEAPADRTGEVEFSAGAGGRLCDSCARDARSSGRRVGRLSAGVLRVASALGSADSNTLRTYRLPPARRGRVRDFVDRFLEYHLETRPRSRRAATSPRRAVARR